MNDSASSSDFRRRLLADGAQIPTLGLGVWQVPDGHQCVNAVRWALDAGYRHIDTAQAYGNETGVGQALRESGVPREEVFITTKFDPARRDPVGEVEQSLRRVLPKSTHRARIQENAHVFDFALSDADMSVLDRLDRIDGTDKARERKWW